MLAIGSLIVALAFAALPRWHRPVALALTAALFVAGAAAVIRLDPLPRIDTWYTVQQAANATVGGHSMYGRLWEGPPEHFMPYTYLPWTAALLMPFEVLVHDVRWGLVTAQLVGAAVVALLGAGSFRSARALLLRPGQPGSVRADTATAARSSCCSCPGRRPASSSPGPSR